MRKIDQLEKTDRDVIALESIYPDGHVVATHTHRRVQLLYAVAGIVRLETQSGTWVVPPGFAIWIPAGMPHQLRTIKVKTHSLYFQSGAFMRPPSECQVIEVPPLLRELISAAIKVPLLYQQDSRDESLMKMLLQEARIQPAVPLHLPMPRDAQLAQLCHAFFDAPTQMSTPAEWAGQLHISTRTFYRRFLANTGMTFIAWRQQACVFVALSRLSLGESITGIALDMGYESPSSFSTMFKKSMGAAPSLYARKASI
ncbi:AraC family transcriptional regulator [Pollutimonas bauzanensis]|uniref:AraC-like ligand binding domain-containing protein n=1 Tax=Pollutimonas bauzanensis TaxID=658167 RepID=A0A1M5NHK6_9BURK|nr:helix-turn-helix domain-containing protein [Pollutimonas bauzanensis]SHG88947.1 AraC-like ligand binding domain-containing protein [Pollutimonas bauzanensis]